MYIKEFPFRATDAELFLHTSFLQLKKDYGSSKQPSRRLSKEEIKKQLMDSLVYNKNIDSELASEHSGKL